MKRYKKIYIEITNSCNLKCDFCPLNNRPLEFMTEESFEKIASSVKHLTDQIYLHVMGEPLLHPALPALLKISEKYGMRVNITTNGFLIHEAETVLLESPAIKQINFSLGSFEANSETVSLETYIENITSFILKAQGSTNIVSSLRLWNMDSDSIKGANAWNDKIMTLIEAHLDLDFSIKEKCMTYRSGKLSNNIYINLAEKFEWPDIEKELNTDKVFCYGLRDQIAILVDGTVVPCCLDSEGNIPLGNIFETSIDDIIDSPRAKAMVTGFTNRKAPEELCRKCGFARRF